MPPLAVRTTGRPNSRRCHLTGSLLHRSATLTLIACVPCLSTCLTNEAQSADKNRKPNIVLIMADDK